MQKWSPFTDTIEAMRLAKGSYQLNTPSTWKRTKWTGKEGVIDAMNNIGLYDDWLKLNFRLKTAQTLYS